MRAVYAGACGKWPGSAANRSGLRPIFNPQFCTRYWGGVDWVPHDVRVREWGSGRTRIEVMLALGRKPRVVPQHGLMDSINAARQTIPLAWFDAARCAKGLEALREYKAEWSEEFRTFKKTPLHNWASHAADAFRYLAMAWREPMADDDSEQTPEQVIAEILRPRTLDQMFAAYAEERADAGYEVESWPLELS